MSSDLLDDGAAVGAANSSVIRQSRFVGVDRVEGGQDKDSSEGVAL